MNGTGVLLSGRDIEFLQKHKVDDEEQAAYEEILTAFHSDPKHWDDPVDFLRNLNDEGIELLKKTQRIPDEDTMSFRLMDQEEALNFILPQTKSVDLNNDGYAGRGNGGLEYQFPPPNAADNVKEAWYAATDGMSDKDKNLAKVLIFIEMNPVNPEGETKESQTGENSWLSKFYKEGFSYADLFEKLLKKNENNKEAIQSSMQTRIKGLLTHLSQVFQQHDIA